MIKNIDNQYITLGKLAKLSHINRDTLSFYVRKELIKPSHIGINGYKYFLPEQIQTINFIRFYRQFNFSLDEIKTMLDEKENNNYSHLHTLEIFNTQQQYLQQKIQTLQSALERLESESTFMSSIEQYELNTPYIEFLEEASYHLTPVKFCYSLKEDIYAQNFSDSFISDGNFFTPKYPLCCIIPNSVILTKNFCPCHNKLNQDIQTEANPDQSVNDIPAANESTESTPFTRPSGKYAIMVNQGGTDSIYPAVRKIISFLQEKSITPKGDAYIINSYSFLNVTENQNNKYLIQIYIN